MHKHSLYAFVDSSQLTSCTSFSIYQTKSLQQFNCIFGTPRRLRSTWSASTAYPPSPSSTTHGPYRKIQYPAQNSQHLPCFISRQVSRVSMLLALCFNPPVSASQTQQIHITGTYLQTTHHNIPINPQAPYLPFHSLPPPTTHPSLPVKPLTLQQFPRRRPLLRVITQNPPHHLQRLI